MKGFDHLILVFFKISLDAECVFTYTSGLGEKRGITINIQAITLPIPQGMGGRYMNSIS